MSCRCADQTTRRHLQDVTHPQGTSQLSIHAPQWTNSTHCPEIFLVHVQVTASLVGAQECRSSRLPRRSFLVMLVFKWAAGSADAQFTVILMGRLECGTSGIAQHAFGAAGFFNKWWFLNERLALLTRRSRRC